MPWHTRMHHHQRMSAPGPPRGTTPRPCHQRYTTHPVPPLVHPRTACNCVSRCVRSAVGCLDPLPFRLDFALAVPGGAVSRSVPLPRMSHDDSERPDVVAVRNDDFVLFHGARADDAAGHLTTVGQAQAQQAQQAGQRVSDDVDATMFRIEHWTQQPLPAPPAPPTYAPCSTASIDCCLGLTCRTVVTGPHLRRRLGCARRGTAVPDLARRVLRRRTGSQLWRQRRC